MRRALGVLGALVITLGALYAQAPAGQAPAARQAAKPPAWAMNATIIEACSCSMFCQCYFNDHPTEHTGTAGHEGHGKGHFCRFNNAVKVNRGQYKGAPLAGARFWVAGDLGANFADGQMDWAVLHFDPSVTKVQREGIAAILAHVYPVKWGSFTVGPDAKMAWSFTKDRAVATLDGGKTAEVVLERSAGMTGEPVVMKNLKYWGAPRNDGFVMMKNQVEAYRLGDKAFEFKGTNGFMITFDIDAKTAPPAAGTAMNE